jgi:preprotein translocase subunit SecA
VVASLYGPALAARMATLRRSGLGKQTLAEGCAVLREIARRRLGRRHHDVQLLGALAILDGRVAEMDTGEGKAITAALAAGLAAGERGAHRGGPRACRAERRERP